MNRPKISVIMSAYNSGGYIEESILSILNQTFKDLELIIVDDCSTDNTPEIIKKYSELDQRVVTIRHQTNSGIAVSRNNGIGLAKADYIAVMDSDDVAYPRRLEVQYNFLEYRSDIAAVASGAEIIDRQGKLVKKRVGLTDPDEIKFRILLRNPFINSSVLFRKKLFDEMGGYNREYEYSEDYSFYSFLSEQHALASIPEILIKYRQDSQSSVTSASGSRKIQIENSLKINVRNINRYLTLKPGTVKILVSAVNQWPINFTEMIMAIKNYKKLFNRYIEKEKLDNNQIKKVKSIYKTDLKRVLGGYFKNKAPRQYSALKTIK